MTQVNELLSLLSKKTCGQVEAEKPKYVFQLSFENVNILGVFATGEARGITHRQMRSLLNKCHVNMASFVETQAEWGHADKGHQIDNIFGRRRDRHSISTANSTVNRIPSPRHQKDGTAMTTFGTVVASV